MPVDDNDVPVRLTATDGARATMTDVANAAGVSLKTVSRVVNEEPGVRPETAALVHEAIAALGFSRNDMARALRRGQRSRTLGLVIEDVANPFYSAITRGVEEVARTRGMLVIAGSSDEDPERERELVHLLWERRVDGLLVVPAGDDHRYLLPELRLGTQAVFIDRPPGNIAADVVLLDNVGGARTAVEHLIAHGHRRIAMVGDDAGIFTSLERLRGYREALAGAGLAIDESLIRLGAHDTAAAEVAVEQLLSLAEPPTALFTGNNRITVGALRALARLDGGVALVGFDDVELAELLARPTTVAAYDAAALGRMAAELLAQRLAGDTRPPQRIVLPVTLIERGSGELRPAEVSP
jgi:LacI family transcriptional regulator, galactose operon repressor